MKKRELILMILSFMGALLIMIAYLITTLNPNQEDNKETNPIYCTSEQKKAQVCAEYYSPTCGWFNSLIQCVKYPCAATYSNPCFACADPKVDYYTDGECPN